jgi:hypothetical protein
MLKYENGRCMVVSDNYCVDGDNIVLKDEKKNEVKSATSKEQKETAKKVCEDMGNVFIDNRDDGIDCISKAEKACIDTNGYWDKYDEDCEYGDE